MTSTSIDSQADTAALVHHRWCVFSDHNIYECLNKNTGSMDCEGPLLTVPLSIQDQGLIKVAPYSSADVPDPYIWLGRIDQAVGCQPVTTGDGGPGVDIWLTPDQAATLGHYLLAISTMIKPGAVS